MNPPCEFLNWDSDFFGVQIARVNGNNLTPEFAHQIDVWCSVEAIDCLYFLADPNDSTTVRLAEDRGYRFVDLRLTFERKLSGNEHFAENVRRFRLDDVPRMMAIARTSYTDSRFYFDPCFPLEKCDAFYETWIRNSCNGFADAVFVAELDGLTEGYISCTRHGTIGTIGLVGVSEAVRGRSLGQALVNSALAWFAEQGTTEVNVVTQGRNIGAQRLYQRCGFLTASLHLWYHKWYNNCGAV